MTMARLKTTLPAAPGLLGQAEALGPFPDFGTPGAVLPKVAPEEVPSVPGYSYGQSQVKLLLCCLGGLRELKKSTDRKRKKRKSLGLAQYGTASTWQSSGEGVLQVVEAGLHL